MRQDVKPSLLYVLGLFAFPVSFVLLRPSTPIRIQHFRSDVSRKYLIVKQYVLDPEFRETMMQYRELMQKETP